MFSRRSIRLRRVVPQQIHVDIINLWSTLEITPISGKFVHDNAPCNQAGYPYPYKRLGCILNVGIPRESKWRNRHDRHIIGER